MAIFWRVLMRQLSRGGNELLCLCPPGDQDSEGLLKTMNAKVINYPLERKGLNPFNDLRSFLSLKKIFRDEKPDLLFATTIKPVIYGLLAARQTHIPACFATITGLGYAFERDTFFKKMINLAGSNLYKFSLTGANGIFFQNNDDKELFIKNGILTANAPIRMAHGTGVDTSHFSPVPLPDIAEGKINFLFIGRLLEAKGLQEYVNAAEKLKPDWPNASFQILGPEEQGPGSIPKITLARWIQEGNVSYLGSCEDVRPHIEKAHVIVLPSWREGTPTAIMEAMSMGRPCVVTDVPGCREVVRDRQNGFLCKAHDSDDLARVMKKFLENPALLAPMGEKSRKIAVTVFDAEKVADKIISDMRSLSSADIWEK